MATRARKRPVRKAKVSEDIFDLIGRTESINQASAAMQAIAHPLRLKILCLVGSQELSVYRIGDPRVLQMISLTRQIFCSF